MRGSLCRNVPLAPFTTFGIGGIADGFAETDSPETLCELLAKGDAIVIGAGSNVLFGDGGYRGTVVRYRGGEIRLSDTMDGFRCVYALGGVPLSVLSRFAASHTLSGLEWAEGIPGSVGGAVTMNAGAFGGDVASVIAYADVLTKDGVRRMEKEKLGFGYRESDFDGCVLGAAFLLAEGDKETIACRMKEYFRLRRCSQPKGKSAGSVFKAVDGEAAYRYILGAGLSGLKRGGAEISSRHANFIVNVGGRRQPTSYD